MFLTFSDPILRNFFSATFFSEALPGAKKTVGLSYYPRCQRVNFPSSVVYDYQDELYIAVSLYLGFPLSGHDRGNVN